MAERWPDHHNDLVDDVVGVAQRAEPVAPRLFPAFDLAAAAAETGDDVVSLATSYFEMPSQVDLDWLVESLPITPQDSHIAQLAKAALADELCAVRVRLAREALRDGGWQDWEAHNAPAVRRVRALAADVARGNGSAPADMAALALGVQLMRDPSDENEVDTRQQCRGRYLAGPETSHALDL